MPRAARTPAAESTPPTLRAGSTPSGADAGAPRSITPPRRRCPFRAARVGSSLCMQSRDGARARAEVSFLPRVGRGVSQSRRAFQRVLQPRVHQERCGLGGICSSGCHPAGHGAIQGRPANGGAGSPSAVEDSPARAWASESGPAVTPCDPARRTRPAGGGPRQLGQGGPCRDLLSSGLLRWASPI